MRVSIDGGLTWVERDNVRIIYDEMMDTTENDVELHLNCTTEGLITDVFNLCECESEATSSEMAQEIVDRLLQGDLE
jgi:hypothetical protein